MTISADPIADFRNAIAQAGLSPPQHIEPGKLHRFSSNGKAGDDAGWCKLFPDMQGGVFGDWHHPELKGEWHASRAEPYTPQEREAFRRMCEAERRKREADEAKRHTQAAKVAASLWKAATEARADHPYLARKGVKPVETLREITAERAAKIIGYSPSAKGKRLTGRLLVAPVKIAGKLTTAELIDEAGRKHFLSGGAKKSGFWAAQALPAGKGESLTLCIGECVATVLTSHTATGFTAIAALDCGNLGSVAETMRKRYPMADIAMLGEAGNGRQEAEEAARAVNGICITPSFTPQEIEQWEAARGGKKPTDWNDAAVIHGTEVITEELAGLIESEFSRISRISRDGTKNHDFDAWADKLPLRRELPPPDPFPIDALGSVLSAAARAFMEVIQAPDALCAQSLLGGAVLAVQAHADVVIDGRASPLSEYLVTIAETGERKSAADRTAQAPHAKRQRDLQRVYQEQIIDFEADHAAWRKAREEALSGKKNKTREAKRTALLELGPEPQGPIDAILTTEEPSYEGLVKALAVGWPSMGLFSDEGGRFLGGHGMNDENRLKTSAGLSKLWDGDPISRTRAGDGNFLLFGRRVCMHLMIQPVVSNLLFGSELLAGQGLLSRCLVAWPTSTIGRRPYREEELYAKPGMKTYFAQLMSILEAPLPLAEGSRNELAPRRLSISPSAKRVWIAFHDHIEALCRDGGELFAIRGLAAKAAEHAARRAGVLALVRNIQASAITGEDVEAGIEMTQFYLGEALRLFGAAVEAPDITLAEKALAWGISVGGQFPMSDLYQFGPYPISDKATAERILNLLREHGLARRLPKDTVLSGKPRRNAWEVRS
jgi:putative DNA primase/helicase